MNAQDKTTGGFAGDLAEAFAPAAGSGCWLAGRAHGPARGGGGLHGPVLRDE